jgi:hypothetical protein
MSEQSPIEIGFQVFAEEGGETFGAITYKPRQNIVALRHFW